MAYFGKTLITKPNNIKCKIYTNKHTITKFDKIIACGKYHGRKYEKKKLRYNENQYRYIEELDDKNNRLVIATGPSGTGKTSIACSESLERLMNNDISKIIITRPTVCVGNELGYLPGNLDEKMSPWIVPIYESFLEEIDKKTLNTFVNDRKIEICPLSHIRGRTLSSCWIIADEMQNCTPIEMKTLLTRVGENAKIIVTGDTEQCDLDSKLINTNGLSDLIYKIEQKNNNKYTNVSRFTINDVQRSEFVKHILKLYIPPN